MANINYINSLFHVLAYFTINHMAGLIRFSVQLGKWQQHAHIAEVIAKQI